MKFDNRNFRVVAFIVLLNFMTTSYANTLRDPYICGQPNCNSLEKFKFNEDITYNYDYNVVVNTMFEGSSENKSTLNIDTKISLEFLKGCEGLLKIHSVSMKDQDDDYLQEREQTFTEKLTNNSLRFALHNGIVTEICPQEEEEDWILNFKRGILSLFQNSMSRFDMEFNGIERDIHGSCKTKYYMEGQQNTSLILMKIKDLTQCIDRYKYLSILQTVRYDFQSRFQTWPVLKSESRCRIVVDHNIYTSVQCRERHLFEPFSGKQSGAMTTVFQNLVLVNETDKSNDDIMSEKTEELEVLQLRYDLLHHHVSTIRTSIGLLQSARDILKQLCKIEDIQSSTESTKNNKKSDSEKMESSTMVGYWGEFIRACRGLSHTALAQLFTRAPTICLQGRKHIIDALPYIASAGSVELIKDMIIKNMIDDNIKHEWLMSMAMIPRPEDNMLLSMGELLKINQMDKYVSLAASSMVHSYCKNNKKLLSECCKEAQNFPIMNIFQNNIIQIINNKKQNFTRKEKETIIISIKSLGNIGGFDNNFRNILIDIIEDSKIPLTIRINAIDAFRKTPCEEMRSYFLQAFEEKHRHVEIRLASYLQVMRCPRYVVIKKILDILKNEEVNQVSSFVWSHLENLGKTTIPSKIEKQGFLSGNFIPKPKHSSDIRKFSRNFEHGIFFDEFNAGGNCEANVILSPDSYIPRSLSLNLTLDMFGESINIFEVKARGEGFEHYIENLFGNDGMFSRSKIDEKLKSIRVLRSADNNVKTINEKINNINFKNDALEHRFPMLDIGMKVFGNEISYWSAEGDDEIKNAMRELNPLHQIKEILSGKEIDYRKASLFLDTTYSIPTGCGLPMTMNLMGTNIVNLKMSGSISNVDEFFQTKNLDFEGKMHPSMALNIAATMGVNAGGFGGTGIRVNFRLHTTTALAANLKLRSAELVSLNISLPHSKQEIFEAKSELIILHGNKEMKQVGYSKNKIEASTCSWSIIDKAIGVKLCAAYEFPNMTNTMNAPYFIMAGPAHYLLSLEKVDPTAKVYSFLYTLVTNTTTNTTTISFSFDTPDSMTKRSFNTSISYSPAYGSAIMTFQSAENFLKAHATYKNLSNFKLIEVILDIDGRKHFDAVMSINKQEQKNGYIFVPKIYVAVNGEKITELAGTLKIAQKNSVSQCDVSLEFQTKKLASRLIGYITWNGPSKGTKLRLDYQFLGEKKETIRLEFLLSNREVSFKKHFYGELGLDVSLYPHLNFFSSVKYVGKPNHADFTFNLSSSRNMIDENGTLQYYFLKQRTLDRFKLHHHLKLNKPYLDVNLNYEENGALTLVSTTAIYDKSRNADSTIGLWGKFYAPPETRLYLETGLNITLPRFVPFIFHANLFEKELNEIDITAGCMWFTGTDISLVALYQDQSSPHLASHRLKAILTSSKFRDVLVEAKYTQDNKQLNINIKADQGPDQYGVMGRYIIFSDRNFSCYGQVEIKSEIYSANIIANLKNDTNILADVHLDQLRDIHITYLRINTPHLKKLNADINWDANRDPNQKLSVALELLNKGTFNYGGSFVCFYPGRLINGEFEILIKDWFGEWLVKLGWSPDDNILWRVKVYSEMEKQTTYAILSEMDTPFQGWRDTSFNLMWRFVDNLQELNANMTWEKEKLIFYVLSDYFLKTNEVYGEINALINSTLQSLPNAAAIARHKHQWRKSSDTLLSFEYNNEGMMMFNSSWAIDRSQNTNNITGRIELKSPFPGFKTGLLATKFFFNQKRDIQGLTHLNLEEKKYTITVEGHTRRFTNSIFNVNVSNEIPSYSLMTARFGIIDTDRHIVALIETPNITVGTEILLKLKSTQDFHVYGHLAIPVEFLQNVKIQAKKNLNEVDFRLGFENMELGFTGVWQYNSPSDFKYLYKLYTPLNGFEENGLVLKNKYDKGLDSEISIKLSKHKLGIAIFIKDDGKGLLKIIEEMYTGIEKKNLDTLIDDFSTDVLMTVDTLYYDTIKFDATLNKVDSEMEEEIVTIKANLHLPNMTAFILDNEFVLENLATMKNRFNLITPIHDFSEIRCDYLVDIAINEKYNISSILLIKHRGNWLENSIHVFYEYEEDEKYSNREASLKIVTQLHILRNLDANLIIYIDESTSKLSANINLPSCHIQATGLIETEGSILETTSTLNLTSPYFQPYKIQVNFKKYFTDAENLLVGGLQIQQGNQNNYLAMELAWQTNSTDHLKFKAHCSLIPIIPPSDLSLEFGKAPSEKQRVLKVVAHVGSKDMLYSLNAVQHSKIMTVIIASPHRGFRNVNFTGEISGDNVITGVFYGDTVTYNINGKIENSKPLELSATMQPIGDGETYTIKLRSSVNQDKYSLTASLISKVQFILHVNLQNGKMLKEFSAKLDSSHQHFEEIFFKSSLETHNNGQLSVKVLATTPLEKLKKFYANSDIILTSKTGSFISIYNSTYLYGDSNIKWSLLANDIYLKILNHHTTSGDMSSLNLNSYYSTGNMDDIGFYINIDNSWMIGANSSVQFVPQKEAIVALNILFPKPNIDVHTIKINLNYDRLSIENSINAMYTTDINQYLARIYGKIRKPPKSTDIKFIMERGILSHLTTIENTLNVKMLGNHSFNVDYSLTTPLYENEETFVLNGNLDKENVDFTIFKTIVKYPASKEITNVDLTYGGMKHTFGKFNTSTPFKKFPWLASDIRIYNKGILSENIVQIFWTNNSALLNSTYVQEQTEPLFQKGIVIVEIPLNTRHVLLADYNYRSETSRSEGNLKMFHNSNQFIDSTYKKVTDRGEKYLIRDTIDININNTFKPVGIHYVHQFDGSNNMNIKQASIYELNNSPSFNLTGRLDIETWKAGKQVKVMIIHGDRTLKFKNNYESKEMELFQSSKIEWKSDIWLEYDILIQNKSQIDDESQQLSFNVRYPERELGIVALYHLKDTSLEGIAMLNWLLEDDNKTVKIQGKWNNPETIDRTHHDIKIILSHPLFKKDVTLTGNYSSDIFTSSNVSAVLEYSDYENEILTFNSILKDNSNGPIRDYRLELNCQHPATNLDLEVKSDLYLKYKFYFLNSYYKFKKSLFNEKILHKKLLIDMKNHIVQFEHTKDEDWYKANGTWEALYPEYKIYFTANRSHGNDTGIFLLSGKNKNVLAHLNRTDSISYHLIGQINDPRSADLIAWRDFEEVKTIDLSSYLRLNHSRLLTSKTLWRPEMYQQTKNLIIESLRSVYSQTNEVLVLIKLIPEETHNALKNVWNDAKPRVKELLNDLNDLHKIKNDIDEFQIFLNESYDANEFYVKNIVEFSYNVIDQLSLRDHVESLPDIINEMWQLMGDTGTSLRKSILWIIDTVKSSHSQLVEKINNFLEADLMDQVAGLIEAGILKYDSFVRNMHLSFIHYCETTWAHANAKLTIFWTNILKALEPAYIQLAHYLESFVFKFGTEIFEFFYARKNEFTETPFFNLLTKFSHDFDGFAKDMQNNDAITNIKKYTEIITIFFKEKVLVYIPFQKELKEICTEIWGELNKLQQLNVVNIIKTKFWEAKTRLQWWYDYFKIGDAIKSIVYTLYQKFTELPRTAIENEGKHRVAKTNFVFDPRKGVILLEQKLPMPWHAFNRTPDFSEIAEYKVVRDFVDTWVLSNTSIMSYYYLYKQYTDIYSLIPPFPGHAVVTGYGTIVTLDRRVFTINEPGTFILLSDFLKNNFRILIEKGSTEKYNLILLTKNLIRIDLFDKTIDIGSRKLSILPTQIDNWIIYRNDEYVTLNNINGIEIKCEYYYKTCKFRIEGWYFSRLGGLLGTMNNEPYDDVMTPGRKIVEHSMFLDSWRIIKGQGLPNKIIQINDSTCENYFRSKVSSLKPCFSVVDPEPFYDECQNGLDPCVLSNAYMEICLFDHIPVRIPNKCMECKTPNGKVLDEGTFSDIVDIPNATDVVFLIEAHACNKNIRKEKNIDILINTLELKLSESGYTNNRYSIIGFGGEGIYKIPHLLYINNKMFTSAEEIITYFDHLQIDDVKESNNSNTYSADAFEAFNVASSLNFRPGVSKTFILFPCTRCDINFMRLDYTVIHQVLMDSSITLHIIMNDEFKLNKKRMTKNLYGIDADLAYTSKDIKQLVGDSKLRQQVKLPKTTLGFCASLAVESNGTIFSGSKMKSSEAGSSRKAAIIFGARAAQSSKPCPRARCECDKARLICSVCPRYISRNPVIDDISQSIWESSEIEDIIDNFLDRDTV